MFKTSIDPNVTYPVMQPDGSVWPHTVYLKNLIEHPKISIGDYTYYNDFRKNIDDYRQLILLQNILTS